MKKLLLLIPVVAMLLSCENNAPGESGKSLPMKSKNDTLSYVIGLTLGQYVNSVSGEGSDFEFNMDMVYNGVAEGAEGKGRIEQNEMQGYMRELSTLAQAGQRKKAEAEAAANLAQGNEFLAANKSKEGVITTPSGLQYKVEKEGTGASPEPTDKVKVHYHGTLIDGTVFDSSVDRNEPTEFFLNQVIKGWTEGIPTMKVGGKTTFYIPSDIAYGPRGRPGIPGNAMLIFDVELLDITTPTEE
ncbi:MAG: FKBP-type peptidyl-prolyl cis-trans isomerase [Bacteroidota bacterium]